MAGKVELPEALARRTLETLRGAMTPGKGKQRAALICELCEAFGWNPIDFLPDFMLRNPQAWGLAHLTEAEKGGKVST